MKKVGIVTFHRSKSYGACLQALATATVIERMGFNPELIDYTNAYEQKSLHFNPREGWARGLPRLLRRALKRALLGDSRYEQKRFGDIPEIYGRFFSKERYHGLSQLKSSPYDMLLAGSDQIWNPSITNGPDPAYLLDFAARSRRISYGSSLGGYRLTGEEADIFRRCLRGFASVSAREKSSARILESILERDIPVVADPSLLLCAREWKTLLKPYMRLPLPGQEYILSYFVGGSSETYCRQIGQVRNALALPVLNIQVNRYIRAGTDIAVADANIADFTALIENAAYIITDSLHGTIFSIIFKKPFLALRNKNNPSRVPELLETLGLESLYENMSSVFPEDALCQSACERLDVWTRSSMEWLSASLSGDGEA